jgi:hypothetical protein
MYAECFVRGAGGNGATALGYVNAVMYKSKQTINAGGLTMDFILDERARELHWEGHRRTFSLFWKIHGAVIYGLERWSCWWITNTIFQRYIPIPAVALSSNLNYNKTRILTILKINKMKNITKSIIALFAVVAFVARRRRLG